MNKLNRHLFGLRLEKDYGAEEILVGDYNINPYDDTLTGKESLSAHRSLANVKTQMRTRAITSRPLYNPSWHLYGLQDGALGTHYYSTPDYDAPWALFDQVITSGGLAYEGDDVIELVTEVNGYHLVKSPPKCIPDEDVGSDHLPLVVRFRHDVIEVGD